MSEPDDVFDDEESDDSDINCGQYKDGLCALAGTEWCDWSCPYSDQLNPRKRAKHIDPRQMELKP